MPAVTRPDVDEREPLPDADHGDEEDKEERSDLKGWLLGLARGICALVHSRQDRPVEDPEVAHGMALATKPYIDRMLALQRLLGPVDRIIEKRDQIQELQTGIVQDVAEVEGLSGDQTLDIDPSLVGELQGEITQIKRDRKIYVHRVEEEDTAPPPAAAARREGGGLLDLAVPDRLELILGTRFVPLDTVGSLLHGPFDEEDRTRYEAVLGRLWETIFSGAALRPHVEGNHVRTLQKTFRDYALVFRTPAILPRADADHTVPCSIESLRRRLGSYFLSGSARSLWYTSLPFYRESIEVGHWALVDRQYLNCTFKKPSIRLLMYARANELPAKAVRQKSAVEDIYDRLVLEAVLKERFFDSCNSLTRTVYQQPGETARKQVYVFAKENRIRISGKRGTPHWRPTKPRWPGVLPSIQFGAEPPG